MGLLWQLQLRLRPKISCSTSLVAGRFRVGQNVFQIIGDSANGQQDWRTAIQVWYDEVKDFSRNDINRFRSVQQQGCSCVSLKITA